MKKPLSLLLLSLAPVALLSGCDNAVDEITKVSLGFGTTIGMEDPVRDGSQLVTIDYGTLASMVAAKKNFLLVVRGSDYSCSCWTEFHENCLSPYIKAHSLLAYMIPYAGIANASDTFGLKLFSSYEDVAIFEDGAVRYQNDNSDETKGFSNRLADFASWMNARIAFPRAIYISKADLDAKYQSTSEFTIGFTRSTCPDCSYLDTHGLKDYLKSHLEGSSLYLLDCDVEGIRYVNGESPSNADDASEQQKAAYAQWTSFKAEYGLAEEESNPAGWSSGFVPTLFHVNPDGTGKKKGDVIDGAGVFFNDSLTLNDDKTVSVSDSYFSESRLNEECLDYLEESNVSKKVLLGQSCEAPGEQDITGGKLTALYRHEQTAKLQDPILNAFLDWSIGN